MEYQNLFHIIAKLKISSMNRKCYQFKNNIQKDTSEPTKNNIKNVIELVK